MWMFIISLFLLVIVAAIISVPMLRGDLEPYALDEPLGEDFSERDALLDALSDLEDSYGAGKLSQADYEAQKQRLQLRYIEVVDGQPAQS